MNSPVTQAVLDSAPLPVGTPASRYATHLPLLWFLLTTFRPQRILEFGLGDYSTPLFVNSGADVVSVEHDPVWFQKCCDSHPRHTRVLWPSEHVQDFLCDHRLAGFDLAFIDGPEQSRVPCVERLFWRARLIVIHDSLTRCYGWNRLRLPAEYGRVDDTRLSPATSVLAWRTEDLDIIREFCHQPLPQGDLS